MPVTARGSGWQAAFSYEGERYRRLFKTHADAEDWIAESKRRLRRGLPVERGGDPKAAAGTTVGELLELVYRRYWQGAKAGRTSYINGTAVADYFGHSAPVASIDAASVREFVLHLKGQRNSDATINRKLAALSRMLTLAQHEDMITRKPHIERLKESEGRLHWWTEETEKAALDHMNLLCKYDLMDFTKVAVDTGLRCGEMLRLTKGDLDWKSNPRGLLFVWESKSGKSRSVPLTARAKDVLIERAVRMRTDGPLFAFTYDQLRHQWDTVVNVSGLSDMHTPHILRHTFCSRLVQRGVNLRVVQELAGHANISVTMRYAKLAPANLTEAIGVLG